MSAQAKRPLAANPKPTDPDLVPITDPGFQERANKGDVEAAYERFNADPTHWTPVPWAWVLVGVLVGLVFTYVNVFAALATGLVVGVSWYLIFMIGVLARWTPGKINYVAGASTGASQVVIGLAFVLPALFLLSDRNTFQSLLGLNPAYAFDSLPSPYALAGFFLIGAVYGLLFFQFYRRLWVVERPLPYPGAFHTSIELLSVAAANRSADRRAVRDSVFVMTVAGLVSMFFVFLRDLRAFGPAGSQQSFLDDRFEGAWYFEGQVPEPWVYRWGYNGLFYLDPFFLAIGWFIRHKIAGLLLLGSIVTHVTMYFGTSAYVDPRNAVLGDGYGLVALWSANARLMAAGAILGAGGLAIWRMRRIVWGGMRTVLGLGPDGGGLTRLPTSVLIGVLGGGTVLGITFLTLGGVPFLGALLVVPVAAVLLAGLAIVAVKVTGETAIQAISPITVIALLALLGLLQLVGFSGATLMILALGTAAFFATGLIVSTDIFLDSKVAHYVGNPPHRQAMVQLAGIVPGVLVGTAVVWFVMGQIVDFELTGFQVPLGFGFMALTQTFTGGEVAWLLFAVAVGLGIAVEIATGMGTVFAIGMALQLFVPVTIFVGALLRAGYERWFARGTGPESAALRTVTQVALPTGVFVGATVAAMAVFVLNRFVLA